MAAELFKFREMNPHIREGPADIFPLLAKVPKKNFGMNYCVFSNCNLEYELTYDEVIHCVQGCIRIAVQGEQFVVESRDTIWLPAGTKLRYIVEQEAIALVVHGQLGTTGDLVSKTRTRKNKDLT